MSQVEAARADTDDHALHRSDNDGDKKPKNRRPASAETSASVNVPLYIGPHAYLPSFIRYRLPSAAFKSLAVSGRLMLSIPVIFCY